jgi:hypothetical protein
MDALDKVFTALRDAGLKLNASQCSFGVNRATYLGHIISKHGIEVDPDKVQAVRDFPVPLNITCYALLRMRPLSISCAEGCVVISCGKVDYDISGWRDD